MLGIERVLKALVVETEQQSAIAGSFRVDLIHAWNFSGDVFQDSLETRWIFALHELHDIAEVVAVRIKVFLGPGHWQATRRIRGEVAKVPSLHELAEGGNARMFFQIAKRGDAEFALVFQCNNPFRIFVLVFFSFP